MTPKLPTVVTGKEVSSEKLSRPTFGDEVVISGMSGLFPKSDSTMAFMENLYNKVDMVEEVSYSNVTHPNLPKHQGKLKNLNKFDAQFFRVTHWQAKSLDPMSRKVMECAFSAIYDSGINPVTLSGTKLGVFVGSAFSDTVAINMFDCFKRNNFIISGCSKTMLANRISYWVDGKGPSFGLDQACTSSMACLHIAYESIKRGDCDSALVGGCSSCVHPLLCINLRIAGHLCLDGKTKCFDKNGDGYVRSEAINILFLQKAKDAKRIYTEVYHVKNKYFTSPDANFLSLRKSKDMEKFLEEFYSEVKISPSEVEYVEAFGSGIAEADGNEIEAIGNFFAKSKSIKVGSVKSNMGHAEAANGVCAVTKMCLAYHKGKLPGNLHYEEPQEDISAIRDGRVEVLTENTSFNRGFTAINSCSFTGANYHVLLKGFYRNKNPNQYQSTIPRLILLSGREDIGMNKTLDILAKQPVDPEQIALLHNIYKQNIAGHTGRSYIVLDSDENNETVTLARSFEYYSGTIRPICFLYSGMGSQWYGMGTELLRIPIFAAAIERCRKVLEPLGADIIRILIDKDTSIFDSILNSMLGISAIQIGLTDVLKAIGIVPDYIIGHSIGELGCAYADGCFTAEEMILSSYSRGLVSVQTPFIKGSMAAIGLGYRDILPLLPPGIEVACHNSAESATISGPTDIVEEFVSDLTKRGIFAKEVACSNIAYHSKYIIDAGPELLSQMQNLIKEPKLRSGKWISTSVPQENWHLDCAKYASAEYFTNNLMSPVYFEENASLIPRDAIIIEIAPHGLLQAILKRSHKNCLNIPLTRRGSSDPVTFFLDAIGKLYQNGLNSQIDILYPKVEFPVTIETPLLSHLVEWEHSVDWPETVHNRKEVKETSERNFVISVHDDDYKFMEGHIRNGFNEFPESALLVLVWETLGMYKRIHYKELSVTFNDVTFHRHLKLEIEDVTRLTLMIHIGSNRFELTSSNVPVVTGFIRDEVDPVKEASDEESVIEDQIILNGDDVYALLCMRGYSYRGDFRSIYALGENNDAFIKWTGEWAPFLDSLLQYNILTRDHDGVSVPKMIQNLSINVDEHKKKNPTLLDNVPCYKTEMLKSNAAIRCGGVQLERVMFDDKPKLELQPDELLSHEFIPHVSRELVDFQTAVSVNLQLVACNVKTDYIKVIELVNSSETITNVAKEIVEKIPLRNFEISSIVIDQNSVLIDNVVDTNLIIVHNLIGNEKDINVLEPILKEDTFVLTFEKNGKINKNNYFGMKVITMMQTNKGLFVMLKKCEYYDKKNILYINIDQDRQFSWLPRVQSALKKSRKVVLVSERQPYCGLFGFVKYLQKYYNGNNIAVVLLNDYQSLSPPDKEIFIEQLQTNQTFNVLNKGQWGSYYYVMKTNLTEIRDVCLKSSAFGNLDSFIWTESLPSKEYVIQVNYAGPSLRDCRKAFGYVKDKTKTFGMDFSGVDKKGQRVMGMVADGAMGSVVEADSSLLWPVPHHWSLEDAATVPRPYIQAFYCLFIRGKIQRGHTVFVTGGSGALGQAAISICLGLNCTVLTSVRDEAKKTFLLRLFPKLKEENIILVSHDSYYAALIELTENRRCDIVINCYDGQLRQASMKCVGFMSTLLDVSDVDIYDNRDFGMSYLLKCKSYTYVNLFSLFKPENYQQKKVIQRLVAEGISNGTVRPLTRVVYSAQEVSRAFRLVSTSRHRGRTLLKMDFRESVKIQPRINFSNGVHIVVCDKSHIGVELIDHLVRNGAKYLIVHIKPDYNTKYLNVKMNNWAKYNAKLEINSENLQTNDGCKKLLKTSQQFSSVSGIYIVQEYNDEIVSDYFKESDFKASFDETVLVTNNLDKISRQVCNGLSYFVYISVVSQHIGSDYAQSACARICEARIEDGLPALALRCEVPIEVHATNSNLLSKLELSSVSSLFNAMDIGLKNKTNNLLTMKRQKESSTNYIQKLEGLIGIQNIEDVDKNKTLKDICINEERVNQVLIELKPVAGTEKYLSKMPIGSLKKICKSFKRNNTNFNAGLGAFYNFIDKNEFTSIEAIIPMNTHLTSFEEDGYLNRHEPHLLMIPGFDGHHHIFNFMAERIKIRGATLQLGPDLYSQSIPDMSKTLAKLINSNFEESNRFYILGYSFGVNVALEVTKLLEEEGRIGVVYCLDSSPDALKTQLNAYAGESSNNNLKNNLLQHIYRLISRQDNPDLEKELNNTDDWSEKIDICVNKLRQRVHYSTEHIKSILQSAYERIILAKEYEPEFKLKSEIVLIRGIPHPRTENLLMDYNLSKYTTKPVKVFHIESDHVSAPTDCRVSNIVNKMLDPKILQEFKTKNLCDVYYRRCKEEM